MYYDDDGYYSYVLGVETQNWVWRNNGDLMVWSVLLMLVITCMFSSFEGLTGLVLAYLVVWFDDYTSFWEYCSSMVGVWMLVCLEFLLLLTVWSCVPPVASFSSLVSLSYGNVVIMSLVILLLVSALIDLLYLSLYNADLL